MGSRSMSTHEEGITVERRFELGQVVITRTANECLSQVDVLAALARHAEGDWGDLCPEDRKANEEALKHRQRLLSAYADAHGEKFWIITEADRSVTTILLPSDY